jgi:hypothetical protein
VPCTRWARASPVSLLLTHLSAAKWANADCGAGTWADAHCMPTEAAADTCCRIGSRFAKKQWGADFLSQEGFLLKKVDTCVEKDRATRTYIHAFGIPLPRTCEGVEIDLGRRLVTASASSASSFSLLAARGIHGPDKQYRRDSRQHGLRSSPVSPVSPVSLVALACIPEKGTPNLGWEIVLHQIAGSEVRTAPSYAILPHAQMCSATRGGVPHDLSLLLCSRVCTRWARP